MNHDVKEYFFGFTLAEVLITLGIIGIVAAYTIPTLMHSYDKSQYLVGLKKAYSLTTTALKQMAADNGCPEDLKCAGFFATGTNQTTFSRKLMEYLKVTKDCGTSAGKGCWPANTNYFYDGSSPQKAQYDLWDGYKFITTDGMSFFIRSYTTTYSPNCDNDWDTGKTANMSQACGWMMIDVNGLKGPNNLGKDTFVFFITNGKGISLYPKSGIDDATSAGSDDGYVGGASKVNRCSSTNKYGGFCSGRILEESWEMNY